jgi:hypothetical protein
VTRRGRATTPHGCPHCRCDWDDTDDCGRVDKDAPFYALVELILSAEGKATT